MYNPYNRETTKKFAYELKVGDEFWLAGTLVRIAHFAHNRAFDQFDLVLQIVGGPSPRLMELSLQRMFYMDVFPQVEKESA